MRPVDFELKQADTAPAIEITALDQDRNPIPLSGSAEFHLRRLDASSEVALTGVTTIDADQEVNPGVVRYAWATGETASLVGTFDAEFQVTFAGGAVETFPNGGNLRIVITEDLGD